MLQLMAVNATHARLPRSSNGADPAGKPGSPRREAWTGSANGNSAWTGSVTRQPVGRRPPRLANE